MGSQEQQCDVVSLADQLKAEDVANRLEGKKQFQVMSRETVYYSRIVWAKDADEAEAICMEDGNWGEVEDSGNWELDGVEEYE